MTEFKHAISKGDQMNKKTLVIIMSSTLLISCSNENVDATNEMITNDEKIVEVVEIVEPEEIVIVLPEVSQQVTELPWAEDENFMNSQQENDTGVLIAGFAAVLQKEPTPAEEDNVIFASEAIKGTIVNPDEVFSFYETAGPYNEARGYKEGTGYVNGEAVPMFGGGVCVVATTLYNTSILSNLETVERHNHSMPVSYVPYGQDAAVASDYMDFKFRNSTDNPLLIWAELIDNRLYIAFYGKESAPEVTWEHETLSETETTTDYITNLDLDAGDENILIAGMDGRVVHSILKIIDKNGDEQTVDMGQSSYAPLKSLIEINE